MDEKNQQELMFKLNMYEQQMQNLQQQMQSIDKGIFEMQNLDNGLNNLVGAEGKEILAPIGRGIFAKTKLLSEELIVDVGGNNLVKKNINKTQEIIQEQISKLEDIQKELQNQMNKIQKELQKMFLEAQSSQK